MCRFLHSAIHRSGGWSKRRLDSAIFWCLNMLKGSVMFQRLVAGLANHSTNNEFISAEWWYPQTHSLQMANGRSVKYDQRQEEKRWCEFDDWFVYNFIIPAIELAFGADSAIIGKVIMLSAIYLGANKQHVRIGFCCNIRVRQGVRNPLWAECNIFIVGTTQQREGPLRAH